MPYVAAIADSDGVDSDAVDDDDAEWRKNAVENNEMFEMVMALSAIQLPESSVSSAAFGSLN